MGLRIGYVSTLCPRLNVSMTARTDVVPEDVVMQIRRAGQREAYAEYSPLSASDTTLVFQFDALLFDGLYGRYYGILYTHEDGEPFAQLEFTYTTQPTIPQVNQTAGTERYDPRCHHVNGY